MARKASPFILFFILLLLVLMTGLTGYQHGITLGTGLVAPFLADIVALTGRLSLVLFFAIYTASATARRGVLLGHWCLAHRRYLGLGLAMSHTLHLLAIYLLLRSEDMEISWVFSSVAAVGVFLLFIMAVTSNDYAQRRLGANWKVMHSAGISYLWVTFFVVYARAATEDGFDILAACVVLALLITGLYRLLSKTARTDSPMDFSLEGKA